jgi:hypothetical protein
MTSGASRHVIGHEARADDKETHRQHWRVRAPDPAERGDKRREAEHEGTAADRDVLTDARECPPPVDFFAVLQSGRAQSPIVDGCFTHNVTHALHVPRVVRRLTRL